MTRDFTSLRADIRRELSSLDRLAAETEQLLVRIPDHPSFVEIRAAGSLLHDFYTGAEKIFQRIAMRDVVAYVNLRYHGLLTTRLRDH
jgi:hypothetical protein